MSAFQNHVNIMKPCDTGFLTNCLKGGFDFEKIIVRAKSIAKQFELENHLIAELLLWLTLGGYVQAEDLVSVTKAKSHDETKRLLTAQSTFHYGNHK